MSTAAILERRERRADGRRLDGRQVALHVDDDFDLAVGVERRQRLEDAVGAGLVVDSASSPPRSHAARTASATAPASVATTTRPSRLSLARSATWTIIGRPAISASGLPGSRVEAMRAGIRTRMVMAARGLEKELGESGKTSHGNGPYRCCKGPAKDLVSRGFRRARR